MRNKTEMLTKEVQLENRGAKEDADDSDDDDDDEGPQPIARAAEMTKVAKETQNVWPT